MPRELRLLDSLRRHKDALGTAPWLTSKAFQRNLFSGGVDAVIDASAAVAAYWASKSPGSVEVSDFPVVRPPFHSFWIESDLPPVFGGTPVGNWAVRRWGAHVYETDEIAVAKDKLLTSLVNPAEADATIEKTRYAAQVLLGGELPDRSFAFPYAGFTLLMDESGKGLGLYSLLDAATDLFLAVQKQPDYRNLIACMAMSLMFAVSLMHCRNATLRDGPINRKVSDAGVRRGHEPLLRYHILEVERITRMLREDGASESQGLKHALHLCRGHFKDFRESGLFGRHKGVFWWGQSIRGTATAGVVDKDYRVVPER